MPKEKIHNRYFGQFATEFNHSEHDHKTSDEEAACQGPFESVPLDDSFVHVGWAAQRGEVEIAILKESDDEIDNDRWHSQLDRDGVNRLIRTLRTARNAAFGKDE